MTASWAWTIGCFRSFFDVAACDDETNAGQRVPAGTFYTKFLHVKPRRSAADDGMKTRAREKPRPSSRGAFPCMPHSSPWLPTRFSQSHLSKRTVQVGYRCPQKDVPCRGTEYNASGYRWERCLLRRRSSVGYPESQVCPFWEITAPFLAKARLQVSWDVAAKPSGSPLQSVQLVGYPPPYAPRARHVTWSMSFIGDHTEDPVSRGMA